LKKDKIDILTRR